MIGPFIVLAALLGIYWVLLGRPRLHRHCGPDRHGRHRSLVHRVAAVAAVGFVLDRWHHAFDTVVLIAAVSAAVAMLAAVAAMRHRRARHRQLSRFPDGERRFR
jgi:hypothetical protein